MKLLIFITIAWFSRDKAEGFLFDDLLENAERGGGNLRIPQTGADLENMLFRSCFVCHGTSVSAVTSSCWETVDEDDKRFVSTKSCFGACSITVLNHTSIGLIDYTRRCEPDCSPDCYRTDQHTELCKYCCYGDRCNDVLPNYVPEGPEMIDSVSERNLEKWLKGSMAKPRHHARDPSNKIRARRFMNKLFVEFGLRAEMQEFKVTEIIQEDRSPLNYRSYIKTVIKGYNVIATIRGRYYGTLRDNVVVILAHYDTHPDGTPGVDDNASGVAALFEMTRLLTREVTCERNNSVFLVATDFKEFGNYWDGLAGSGYTNCIIGERFEGLAGSAHFLCGYLLPHLRRTGSRVRVAINLHSILNYNPSSSSQSLPNLRDFITGASSRYYRKFEKQVSKRRYAGDWILASYLQLQSETVKTRSYVYQLVNEWRKPNSLAFQPGIIQQQSPIDNSQQVFEADDCYPFSRLRSPMACITLTDTGPLRGYMKRCHNHECDDHDHVTKTSIKFAAKVIDTVWRVVDDLTYSTCPPPSKTLTTTTSQPVATTARATTSTTRPTTSTTRPATSTTRLTTIKTATVTSTTMPTTSITRVPTRTTEVFTTTRTRSQSTNQGLPTVLTNAVSASLDCNEPLIKPSRRDRRQIAITATCRYTASALELCTPPSDGVWATLNSGTAWIPTKAKKQESRNLWFQVDLGRRANVTTISVQGVPGQGYLLSFMISYSNNGRTWNWHIPVRPLRRTATEIKGNKNGKKVAKRPFAPRILARYIRIHPRRWRRRIALRTELYGCFS